MNERTRVPASVMLSKHHSSELPNMIMQNSATIVEGCDFKLIDVGIILRNIYYKVLYDNIIERYRTMK